MKPLFNRTALSLVLALAGFTVLVAAPPDGPPPFAAAVAPSGDVAAAADGDSDGVPFPAA